MKSYSNLFAKIVETENIRKAIRRSSLGKRDRRDVKEVLFNEDYYIKKVQGMLTNKTFQVPGHHLIEINDGISQKKRKIVKPNFKYEQIIHHAIIQVLMPMFRKGMYEYTCGSIPNRGAHYGKKYIEKYIKKHPKDCKYCFKGDIHHFFQSISHKMLKDMFKKKIKDKDTLWLLFLIIDSYKDHEDSEDKYGVPIGYYTSQWFSNWFLEGLDHFIKEKLCAKCYVRYMDDFIIFGSNKRELHKMKDEIAKYLKSLKLELKHNWQIFLFDNGRNGRHLDFMGFKFYRHKTILRKPIVLKAVHKAKKIKSKKRISWYDACQMMSYLGWFKSADMYNCFSTHIKPNVNVRYLRKKISLHSIRRTLW